MTGIELSVILQRLDRVWYDFDGGYDDTNNPFASIPEEYTKKKEEQLAKHTIKRMSAHQRQINKVREGRRSGGESRPADRDGVKTHYISRRRRYHSGISALR